MDIHTFLCGLAAELAATEVEPTLGAVEVDGVDYGSYACGLAVVVALIAVGSRQAAVFLFFTVSVELILRCQFVGGHQIGGAEGAEVPDPSAPY